MRCSHVFAALSVAMLVACGSNSSSDGGAASAEAKSRSALASLPVTVVGTLDLSSGERGQTEDGTVMRYGSLRVADEDFYIQANAEMLESSGIEGGSHKVRVSISAKTTPFDGGTRYTVISADKL